MHIDGTLEEGKTRFAIYAWDGTNNDALYIGGSQYLNTDNNFTLSGKISSNHLDNVTTIRIYAQPYNASTATINNVYFQVGTDTSTWYPYSNICPIAGRTGLSVYVGPTTAQADATTYAVDWTSQAGTVYGGTDEVVGGVLTDEWAEIPSYNGETITEPWLSSMDAYTPGATPTTGAQVVYKLATPLTYQLTPQTINLLAGGMNYVWSDTDEDITISFDVAAFIRQLFRVNGVDFSRFVERDSYATALEPVYAETIQTMDGVNHTALLRTRGSIRLRFNPQTDSDTAARWSALLAAPCEVQYRCLQRDVDVTALMVVDTISAQYLSRCLYLGDEWNQIESITLTEL